MKNKHSKDSFDTYCWYYDIITDPYQVIAEFFSTAGVHDFRQFVTKLLHYDDTCAPCEVAGSCSLNKCKRSNTCGRLPERTLYQIMISTYLLR